jgi:galactokinase
VPLVHRVTGPGRVNLIGDHTDYNQGLALPMAIDLDVTVTFAPDARPNLAVWSDALGGGLELPSRIEADAAVVAALEPPEARLIGAMIALSPPPAGGVLGITSTLPTGAGLSSSAALSVALAEVFGDPGPAEAVARLCQRAEHLIGAPIGAMDPLVCAGGVAGHAMLIDFSSLDSRPVAIPLDSEIVVVDSGQRRTVRSSAYSDRVSECRAAAEVIGPLGLAHPAELAGLKDPVWRRRARHVVSECERVRETVVALEAGDLGEAGRLMAESHRSLAADFEVSTTVLDDLVGHLRSIPGVLGARMTGAGFGGCAVALCRPGAIELSALATPAWRVRASDGTVARRLSDRAATGPA